MACLCHFAENNSLSQKILVVRYENFVSDQFLELAVFVIFLD